MIDLEKEYLRCDMSRRNEMAIERSYRLFNQIETLVRRASEDEITRVAADLVEPLGLEVNPEIVEDVAESFFGWALALSDVGPKLVRKVSGKDIRALARFEPGIFELLELTPSDSVVRRIRFPDDRPFKVPTYYIDTCFVEAPGDLFVALDDGSRKLRGLHFGEPVPEQLGALLRTKVGSSEWDDDESYRSEVVVALFADPAEEPRGSMVVTRIEDLPALPLRLAPVISSVADHFRSLKSLAPRTFADAEERIDVAKRELMSSLRTVFLPTAEHFDRIVVQGWIIDDQGALVRELLETAQERDDFTPAMKELVEANAASVPHMISLMQHLERTLPDRGYRPTPWPDSTHGGIEGIDDLAMRIDVLNATLSTGLWLAIEAKYRDDAGLEMPPLQQSFLLAELEKDPDGEDPSLPAYVRSIAQALLACDDELLDAASLWRMLATVVVTRGPFFVRDDSGRRGIGWIEESTRRKLSARTVVTMTNQTVLLRNAQPDSEIDDIDATVARYAYQLEPLLDSPLTVSDLVEACEYCGYDFEGLEPAFAAGLEQARERRIDWSEWGG